MKDALQSLSAAGCATTYYPIDMATLIEFSLSCESVGGDSACHPYLAVGY